MEKFKAEIRKRMQYLILLFVSLLLIYMVLFLNQERLPRPSDHIISFHGGALTSLGLLLIIYIFINLRAIRDDKELRKLYIKENDERTAMILQKTGAIGINICILGFATATIIAGYYSDAVFFTLLGSTIFVSLVKGLFKIYYHNKV